MLVQLRNGFDNEARRVILECTVCAINDLIMLPFLLIVCSPLGMVFGRDRPLWRNFSCCRTETIQDNNSDSDTGLRSAAQPPQEYNLEGDLSRLPPGKLDMTTRSWYFLIVRQFALLVLDLLVLPFTCIVFCTHHMWDHIWHNLLGGYFAHGPVSSVVYETAHLSTRLKPITTKDSAARH